MAKPDTIIVDDRAYSWQCLCELRRQKLEAWRLSQPEQPVLFPLKADRRPQPKRTVAGRYLEPTLFAAGAPQKPAAGGRGEPAATTRPETLSRTPPIGIVFSDGCLQDLP
jgi:hypothetical protein